ncbi:hypothetical protein ABB55_20910 [Prosthecomicrobium hirschii]|uniref:Uncharacterized protein n=1 Tax=Prosthecodimorpha hirschii TaxID=665126 RepID=A0A0P6WHX2_9HYPH|nr:hypothetical protein [Prosthecomicrobium hirschii]KPL54370.1 hypothetical protein ABB55_20910 [Prosthecomicrobium hirschii]
MNDTVDLIHLLGRLRPSELDRLADGIRQGGLEEFRTALHAFVRQEYPGPVSQSVADDMVTVASDLRVLAARLGRPVADFMETVASPVDEAFQSALGGADIPSIVAIGAERAAATALSAVPPKTAKQRIAEAAAKLPKRAAKLPKPVGVVPPAAPTRSKTRFAQGEG